MGEAVSGGAAGQQLDSAAERHHVGVKTLQLITGVVHLSARTQTSEFQHPTSLFMLMMWNVTKFIYSVTLTLTKYFHFMAHYTFHSPIFILQLVSLQITVFHIKHKIT